MKNLAFWLSAIEIGATIQIRYNGGSKPGTVREIEPRAIRGETLRALCLSSHAVKGFSIAKIEVLADHKAPTAPGSRWEDRPDPPSPFVWCSDDLCFAQVAARLLDDLSDRAFRICVEEDDRGPAILA